MENIKDNQYEIVIAAAVMYENYIVLGNKHSDCPRSKEKQIKYTDNYDIKTDYWGTQFGYVTNKGFFVDKKTAWKIAERAGLIDENPQCFTHNSEDYYKICGKFFDLTEAKRLIIKNCEKEKDSQKTESHKVLNKKLLN